MDTTPKTQVTPDSQVRQAALKGPSPKSDAPAPAAPSGHRLGLLGASALVVGSIVGVGIFNLPSALAPYGPITLVSMGLTTIGALALAWLFASLARRMPAPGGPYAYARVAFGNGLGFANAWSYWITAWAGNAAIAVGWVLYVEVFINKGQTKIWTILLVLAGLWVPAFINLSGLKNMGWFQRGHDDHEVRRAGFMSIVGLFYIKSANFTPFNVSGPARISAVGSGMAIALFSYLGLEVASVAAAKVRDPDRNVPRATMLGTFATAVVYMLSLVAVFGIVSDHALQKSTAPFSTAVNTMFGGTVWGNVMAVVVIISGIGALNGWTMITAEMPRAAAQDGVFPQRFERLNRRGAPAWGIVFSTALASIAMIINYLGSNGVTVFTTLVLMTGITAAIPYGFSALAQIKWRIADQKKMETPRFIRDMIVAVLAVVFSAFFIYYSRDTGHSFWVYWASVPADRRRVPDRDPGLQIAAPPDDRPRRSTAVPVSGRYPIPARAATLVRARSSRSAATPCCDAESRSRRRPRHGRPGAAAAPARAGVLDTPAGRHPRQRPPGGPAGADERCLHRDGAVPARRPRLRDRGPDRLRARARARQRHTGPGDGHGAHARRRGCTTTRRSRRPSKFIGPVYSESRGALAGRAAWLDGQARRRRLATRGRLAPAPANRAARCDRAPRRRRLPRRLHRWRRDPGRRGPRRSSAGR